MIQVIHRALNILELLAQEPQKEFFLAEIAESLNLNKATCANIIKTLTERGYIEHEEQRKGYKLGHMVYKLTNSTYNNLCDFSLAKEPVNRLRDAINENVILSIISNGKRVLLHEAETGHELSVKTTYEEAAYKASTGRVILAHYPPRQLDGFIAKYGLPTANEWPEIKTREELIRELENIRRNPCYIYINSKHVASVTVPLLVQGKIVAALGVYLPNIRFSESEREKIIKELAKTAQDIQNRIGQA